MSSIREQAEKLARDYAGYWGRNRADAVLIRLVEQAIRNERGRAAKIAENPYGDEVEAFAGDGPLAVGQKIAAAIRKED